MDARPAEPGGVPPPRPRTRWVPWLAIGIALASSSRPSRAIPFALATVMAVIVILASGTVWVLEQGSLVRGSQLVEVVGRGHAIFDVPIMTLYTAPRLPGVTVDSTVRWEVRSTNSGPSTTYAYDWRTSSGSSLPVRFVFNMTSLTQTGFFDRGPSVGTLLFYPAGPCGTGCLYTGWAVGIGGAGLEEVTYYKWNVAYTVYRITDIGGGSRARSLLVEFSVVVLGIQFGEHLPAANVSAAGPADIVPIATVGISAGEKVSVSARGAQGTSQASVSGFQWNVTRIALDAGPEGTVMAQLVSRYRWSPVDDYVVSFSASSNTTIQYFFDLRFGSILIQYA